MDNDEFDKRYSKEKFEGEIKNICNNIAEILINKNKDYGNSFYEGLDEIKQLIKDKLNINIILRDKGKDKEEDKKEYHSITDFIHYIFFYVREKDKLNRFKNLLVSDSDDKFDKIHDSVLDIIGYGILFLNYMEKEKQENRINKMTK